MDQDYLGSGCLCLMGRKQLLQVGVDPEIRKVWHHELGKMSIDPKLSNSLLYGCVTWALDLGYFAELQTAHHNLLLRIIGF